MHDIEHEPLVYIIILNWNGWPDTINCLLSLKALMYHNVQTLVIDNGSQDDSVERIRERFPDIRIVETKENLGFAGGCNRGVVEAIKQNADYVWLLNNDAIVEPYALTALVEEGLKDATIGAVGSVIMDMEGERSVQHWGGGYINMLLGVSMPCFTAIEAQKPIDYITGGSMLLSRACIAVTGMLDDHYFMYWEDADYCFRLRENGLKLAVASSSVVYHKRHASLKNDSCKRDCYQSRSAKRFFSHHSRFPLIPVTIGAAVLVIARIMRGKWKNAVVVIMSTFGR